MDKLASHTLSISNANHPNILVRTLQHIFGVYCRGGIHALAGGERVVVEKSKVGTQQRCVPTIYKFGDHT